MSHDGQVEKEDSDFLHGALLQLPPDQSELVALHLVGELSFRRLAEICDCDRKTVRKRFLAALHRTRVTLRSGKLPPEPTSVETPWAARPPLRKSRSANGSQSAFRLHASDDGLSIGSIGRVGITHWYGKVTASSLDMLLSEAWSFSKGRSFGYFAIVERSCQTPLFAERAKLLEMLRFFRSNVVAYASVSYGHRHVRPIMNTLALLARAPFPLRFFPTVEDGADWLTNVLAAQSELPSASALSEAVHALCSCHVMNVPQRDCLESRRHEVLVHD